MKREWRFFVTFLPIVLLKLSVFHFATTQTLYFGSAGAPFHIHGMDFEVFEYFDDFNFYYMNFTWAFVEGNLPYTDGLLLYNGSQTYIYPPLFVYLLTAFYYIPSEFLFPDIIANATAMSVNLDFLRVGFAFIFFDLATCVVMYFATRQLTKNPFIPAAVMLAFALNPISIWWGNYLWLSTPIHTFFLVLGFYLMIRGNLRGAVLVVTLATMVKQTAAILLPLIWFLEYRRGLKQLFISVSITTVVGIILSMPYLILYPATYIDALTRGMGPYPFYDSLPQPTFTVPLSVLAFYWPEPFKFILFSLVANGIPWLICILFFWVIAHLVPEQPQSAYLEQLLLLALLLSLSAHIFLPRGIYKFYLIAMIPFLILFGAILHGPLVPVQGMSCPVKPRGMKFMTYLPSGIVQLIQQFQDLSMRLLNNITTWWFILVGLVSIGIFAVHRFWTHAILLVIFVLLLAYGAYQYVWKWQLRRKAIRE
jgi:Gpi18-like mannosyltransferase